VDSARELSELECGGVFLGRQEVARAVWASQLWTSWDRGATWTARGQGGAYWDCAVSSVDGTHLVAVSRYGGIFTSSGPVP